MIKLAPAKSLESVKRNIDIYWETARENPDLMKDAAKVRQWKGYRTSGGGWRFGPSRFVGYEQMTPDLYVEQKKKGGYLNGTETEQHLKQWTDGVTKNSDLYHRLLDTLTDFLGEVDIAVNRSARFSIFEVANQDELADPDNAGDREVEALATLSKRLTPTHLQKLMRRLEAI